MRAGVRHDDADVADLDDGLGDHLDRREEAVDVVGALDEHLELAAAQAAGGEERSGSWKLLWYVAALVGIVADDRAR